MSDPREVVPGRCYMITRRCTQRQFLLRPDRETNNNFLYCLAEAASRFEIDVLLPSALSNHHLCGAAHKRCYGERLVMRSWPRKPALFAPGVVRHSS